MNFSTDRDLIAIEPNLFIDVPLVGQERLRVADGVVAGTTLTSVSADFIGAGVGAGSVVLVSSVPHEVVGLVDANNLDVSLLRENIVDPAIPSRDGSDLEVVVRTYAPQAAVVHDILLKLIGIDTDDPGNHLTEAAVVSKSLMARLEALGVLARVYAAAAGVAGENEQVRQKAADYERRYNTACRAATVLLDVDGDGVAEVRRGVGVVWFSRV
jgi:hypothetical protein